MKKPKGLALIVAQAGKEKGDDEESDSPKSSGQAAACKEIWEAIKEDEYSDFKTALSNYVALAGE